MEKDLDYLKKLLKQKKNTFLSEEESKKLVEAESLLQIKGIFFKLDIDTAFGLLYFIGIPKENLKEMYLKLTSIEAFQESRNQEYTLIPEEDILSNIK